MAAMTCLNLRGIRSTARANQLLLVFLCTVIVAFIVLAIRHLFVAAGWSGLLSTRPFYNPATFDTSAITAGISLAALTYIGFDGVTLLAEEVDNPRLNVLLATVLVCLFTGAFSGLQIYLAQLVTPDFHAFPQVETAFMEATQVVGGQMLFTWFGVMLVVNSLGCGLTGQVGAARLLFSLGRDRVLPPVIFAHLDEKRSNPTYNICIISVLAYAGSLLLSYAQAAEVLNFGAFVAFMGVNLAALRQLYFVPRPGHRRRFLADAVLPSLGFLACLMIWWNLQAFAKIIGGIWLLAGLISGAAKTRGFRTEDMKVNFTPDL